MEELFEAQQKEYLAGAEQRSEYVADGETLEMLSDSQRVMIGDEVASTTKQRRKMDVPRVSVCA